MANLNAMFFLGIIIGSMAGFCLTWWLAGKGPPPEPFFLRFLRIENKSARLDTRLMLHELHRKVEDLSGQVQRVNLEMQDLQKKAAGEEGNYCFKKGSLAPVKEVTLPGLTVRETGLPAGSEPLEGLDRCREIYRLFQEGLTPGDIARQLRMGRGEVELVLSLDKKPFWVISAKKN